MTHASSSKERRRNEAGIDFDQSPRELAGARLDFPDAGNPHASGDSDLDGVLNRHGRRR
jgi:hypothetical protein